MAAANSSEHSSPEEYEDEPIVTQGDQWQSRLGSDQASPSMEENLSSSSQASKMPAPMQKRRRVTRACDECRRKKIKCDGKQPCTHCTVYSYECTYDQPSNRRRNPAPQYIEAIENRLHRAETLLKNFLPDVDLNDPKFDHGVPQRMQVPANQNLGNQAKSQGDHKEISAGTNQSTSVEKDSLLESMVENTGSLDLDDRGFWDFHGHSSGLVFLRRMREQFGDLMGETTEAPASPFRIVKPRPLGQVFDSPRSAVESPSETNLPNTHDLPSKMCAQELCESALDVACALFRFVHQPTFYVHFNRVYDIPPDQYGNEENKFLPLLYMVLAVGCLFSKTENSKLQSDGYENAIDQGFIFFKAARQMMDITDCRDLISLQAVLFKIMFLQSSAKLATCYSYIGVALRSAIRMGLHRSISRNFNPIERETRRRIFWTIRKMDIYVGAILGLPKMLNDDDIDQELPEEVEDEFISSTKILSMPSTRVSLIAASNAHTRLLQILEKVVKHVYPIKGLENVSRKSNQSYMVSHARIQEIEQDLQDWMENLSMTFKPGGDVTPELARVQQLLRIAYAHVQIMLYRPFLHYVSHPCQAGVIDKRSYACAAACVSVSRNVLHITAEMKKRGLLVGAYWFTMYTTFFAILSLIFFVFENLDSPTSQDILRDAMEGKDTLASLASRSMAADRCSVTLEALFGQLPEKLRRGRVASTSSVTKKRRQQASPSKATPREQSSKISSDIGQKLNRSTEELRNVQRARTFPINSNISQRKRASVHYDPTTPTQNVQSSFEPNYTHSSNGTYTPTSSDPIGVRTPDSVSSNGVAFNASTQPPLGYLQGLGVSGLPDLSAMMFPTGDPFAYPNQPMTTLEDRQFMKQEPPGFDSSSKPTDNLYSLPQSATANCNPRYDNLEVQLLGPLPTYLMQGQQPSIGPQSLGTQMGINGHGGSEPSIVAMNGGMGGWGGQQIGGRGTPGMNLDEIFGDEWKGGWMDQGSGY